MGRVIEGNDERLLCGYESGSFALKLPENVRVLRHWKILEFYMTFRRVIIATSCALGKLQTLVLFWRLELHRHLGFFEGHNLLSGVKKVISVNSESITFNKVVLCLVVTLSCTRGVTWISFVYFKSLCNFVITIKFSVFVFFKKGIFLPFLRILSNEDTNAHKMFLYFRQWVSQTSCSRYKRFRKTQSTTKWSNS